MLDEQNNFVIDIVDCKIVSILIERGGLRIFFQIKISRGILFSFSLLQADDDEENPFGDDVGNNVVSFNEMDVSKMKSGKKADVPFA